MKMKFMNDLSQLEPQVQVTLNQDGDQLDLLYNDILVGLFADGEFYLCFFSATSKDMHALQSDGVKFEKYSQHQYQIKINR